MENNLVSVIIPTYNRFKFLLNALRSVKEQTYKNIEIIIINDGSTQQEYYNFNFENEFGKNIKIIHLDENSRKKYKCPSPGAHARNIGIKNSNGYYLAFLDDDDFWLSQKLEIQIKEMKENNYEMCACQSYFGNGLYNSSKKYQRLNEDRYNGIIKGKFKKQNSNLLDNGFPDVFTLEFQTIHNCLSTPCIIMTKNLIIKTGDFDIYKRNEDADYWKRALRITNGCLYIQQSLVYIDDHHGDGRLY